MARLLSLVLTLTFAAGPAFAQDKTVEFERLLARAMELHQAGDMLGAIDTYKAALTIIPDRADALSNLGAAYVRLGQDEELIALLRPREQMFGNDLAYAYLLGTALLHAGQAAEGQTYVDRVFGA